MQVCIFKDNNSSNWITINEITLKSIVTKEQFAQMEYKVEEKGMKIDVLGTEYKIEYRNIKNDRKLDETEGYTDLYKKLIVIGNIEQRNYFKDEPKEKISIVKNKVLRHEIVHAFLYESGLDTNSNRSYSWADNEEMVDWFAIQSPKIYEIYKKLNII